MDSDSDEVSLKELILKIREWWRFLLSRWKIIFLAGILGGAIGLIYSFVKKPIYNAELSFALQDEKGGNGLSSAMGLASQFGIDLGGSAAGGEFAGDNLLELMKSRSMLTKSLLTTVTINNKRQTLAELYIDFNGIRKKWQDKPTLANLHFPPGVDSLKLTLTQDSLLGIFHKKLLKENVAVEKIDKKLSIITVNVSSTNELFSKYFAETLVKVVSDFYIETKTAKAARNVAILQRQTDSVRKMLFGAISNVAASTDVNPSPNPLLSVLRVAPQHKQVGVQTNGAVLSQLVVNLEIAKMALLQATPLIQTIDTPILPLDRQTVGKAKGIIIGGILGLLLITAILTVGRIYKNIITDEI